MKANITSEELLDTSSLKKTAFLGLGGNIGDVKSHFKNALKFLDTSNHIDLISASSIYETPPWGVEDQPVFLNMCLEIKTSLSPIQLLELCQSAEHSLNRERTVKWGPRTLDIDILLMEGVEISLPDLVIPHPRITKRAFVLVPLAEVAPERVLEGCTIASWKRSVSIEGIKCIAGSELFKDLNIK